MLQWWLEQVRSRDRDRARAYRVVQETAAQAVREAFAEYDAFVPQARSVRDGLQLGTARSSEGEEILVRLPWGEEYRHWLVQGGTGTGKTTWVASLLREMLAAGRAFGVVDCKGDLFASAIRWVAAAGAAMAPAERERLKKRLVILNPFSDALVPLNVCRPLSGCPAEVQAYEVTLALARLFDRSLGLHMENILRHLMLLLMEAGLSLVEAPLLLQDEVLRGILANRSANPAVKEFFLGTYHAVPQVSKDALLSRLQALLLPENLRLMLGAEGLLDLRAVIDRGDPLLVFLGKGPGIPEEQVEVLGSLLVQLLLQAVYARGTGCERRYLLAADEFFHLLDAPAMARRFETALTTVRSFGFSLMLIHHNLAQLPTGLREVVLGNCDLVALFRTSGRNAEGFGDFLPETDPALLGRLRAQGAFGLPRDETRRRQLEALQRLPDRECYWYDRRKPHRAVRLRVPDLPPPHEAARLSQAALENLIRREGWEQGGAAVPRAQLREEIEARAQRLRLLIRPPIRVSPPVESPPVSGADTLGGSPGARRRKPKLG